MSSSEFTEFIAFTLKHPEDHHSASFTSVIERLKATNGGTRAIYHGTRLEDPNTHLVVVRWSTHDDFAAFSASEDYTPWLADFKALATNIRFYQTRLTADAVPALDAPCTEVLVAFGIQKPAFVDNLEQFSTRMAEGCRAKNIKGWHANAHGEITTPIAKDWNGEVGPAATLVIGWDSIDDHTAAKRGPGPILDHIELIRKDREDMILYHVNLKRLD